LTVVRATEMAAAAGIGNLALGLSQLLLCVMLFHENSFV
jgi:hypothetical protein